MYPTNPSGLMRIETSLVSVMMPSYNANATLPRAIASLLAQTHENWECLLVDDGSDESPREIVEAAHDDRIRLITLNRNYGRGVARQTALDNARGKYLAMLDADDWMFPTRLADQVAILNEEPDLALVSSSTALIDDQNNIIAVRPATSDSAAPTSYTLNAPTSLPVIFAASMIPIAVARQGRFDSDYRRSEDHDFLRSILLGRRFVIMPLLHYAYYEQNETTLRKMLQSHQLTRRSLRKHVRDYPAHVLPDLARSFIRSAAYAIAFAVGAEQKLIMRRSNAPTDHDRKAFAEARAHVDTMQTEIFGRIGPAQFSDDVYVLR